jgi:hypothetical protein
MQMEFLETYEKMGKGSLYSIKGDLLAFALPLQSALILIHLPFNSTSILININKIWLKSNFYEFFVFF